MTAPLDDRATNANVDAVSSDQLDAPPRPVWSLVSPAAPWCPPEWEAVLAAVVPLWSSRAAATTWSDAPEAIGLSLKATGWEAIAASRRGRLHAHRGDFREDAIALHVFDGGWCGAVADGAGSAPWSRIGATVATHTFCAVYAQASGTTDERSADAARAVFTTLRTLAERLEILPRTLRTTLIAVIVTANDVVTMQVGDGGVVVFTNDRTAHLPQVGDAGEFSGDVTLFLPDDGSGERLAASRHSTPARDVRAVLLASDGIEDPWYPLARHATTLRELIENGVSDELAQRVATTTSVQMPFRGAVSRAEDPVRALAEWMAFEKRGENDDRSLLFARFASPV